MSEKKTTNIEEVNAELAARVQELEVSLAEAQAKGAKVAIPIPGKYTLELETPQGKKVKRTIRFKPGRVNCVIPQVGIVPSEALLKIANGKDIDEETLQANPLLRSVTPDIAQDHLHWLASVQAGNIEDV